MTASKVKAKFLKDYLQAHSADVAIILLQEEPKEVADLTCLFEPKAFAPSLQALPAAFLVDVFHFVTPKIVAAYLQEFPANLSAAIVSSLNKSTSEDILSFLDDSVLVSQIRKLLSFAPDTVGFLMSPNPFTVKENVSVEELRKLLKGDTKRYGRYVYVVKDDQKLTGVVSFKDLFYSEGHTLISSLMKTKVVSLSAEVLASEAILKPEWKWYPLLPVVDRQGFLIGALREERLEDCLEKDGVKPQTATDTSEAGKALGEVFQIGLSAAVTAFGFEDSQNEGKNG